jgi:hypothetical protein
MNPTTTLFFPDTTRIPETAAGLLLLFENIFYYLPAEPGPESVGESYFFCETGLHQGYAPAPLGDDLDRFDRTIRELQTNLYDYAERLKGLSVASLTAERSPDNDETSVSSLVSAILTHQSPTTEKQSSAAAQERNELWQARIVLKLAESYDREKEEIDARLEQLSHSEGQILSSLTGDDTDEKLDKIPTVTGEGLRTKTDPLSQRIKAWSRLFLDDSDNDRTQSPYILSTTRRDVVQILFDAYEERCKQQPGIVFSIPLPDLRGLKGDELVNSRDAFRADTRDILDQVQKVLMDTATGVMRCPAGKSEHIDPDWLTTWAETLGRHFPSADSNHGRLTVYCLDNTPLADLLSHTLQTIRHDKAVPNRYPTGLIALLDP